MTTPPPGRAPSPGQEDPAHRTRTKPVELVIWGAHGGAGTSTLAAWLQPAWDAGSMRPGPSPQYPAQLARGRVLVVACRITAWCAATEEDRAKARGFMDRSAITVLAGLPPRELARVSEITPLTGPEQALVASWSAPESYQPGARHPGRGKYLIKTGERLGIPVQLTLVGPEHELYDTDPKFESFSEWSARNSGVDAP